MESIDKNEIELVLIKKVELKLRPFGKFKLVFSYTPTQRNKVNVITLNDLVFSHKEGMPYSIADNDKFVGLMKKNKTSFLINSNGLIYTRIGDSFLPVMNDKLERYKDFLKSLGEELDNNEAWSMYIK